MKKLLSLCAAVCCVSLVFAENSVITYKAASKLTETTVERNEGLHTNAFGVTMLMHDFADGVGTITFDGEVTYIGYNAFCACAITSIDLPATIDSIGELAFSNCYNLQTITFPESVTALGTGIFNNSGLESFVFPKRIKKVAYRMFRSSKLKSVTLNDSITAIDGEGFLDCSNLISVILPDSLVTIGKNAFGDCTKLDSIILPESLKEIGEYAFIRSGLSSIAIPKNVDNIASDAFTQTSNLATITVDAANTNYDSRNNCNAIIEKSTNTLIAGCKNTVIPESVIALGGYAFAMCTFDSIVIPKNVTSVGEATFGGCSNLTSIVLPASVTSLGVYAFGECANLKTVYCLADSVPAAEEGAFEAINEEATLYVQAALVESFKADEIWNNAFKYILPIETPTPTAVENASVVELYVENGRVVCTGEFRIYDMLGRDVTRMNGTLNGVYVVTCGDKSTKIVVK